MRRFALYAAYGSVAAAAVSVITGLLALVHWRSGSPFPELLISVGFCLTGFAAALVAQGVGSDRRQLRIGLAALIGNALIGAMWGIGLLVVALGVASTT